MEIEVIKYAFSVCRVSDWSETDPEAEFCFIQKTDTERSLVCLSERVPPNVILRDDGWRCFRVCGQLDFSLVGVLSGIASALAKNKIPIFAVSTFDTDYIFVKENDLEKALDALANAGYGVIR